MNEREIRIIEAAMRLFIRYGVKRTGMNDIASEAGISRQTLYNAFANKDAVLQATIRLLADKVIADIEAGLKKADGLGDQLDVIFKHIAIEHFDLMHTSPNAEDIVAGFNASSQNELEEGAQRNIEVISRVIGPYASEIEENGLTVAQFADFVQRSATAAKYNAKSRKHLLDLLGALRVSVLKVTGGT
ncbi:TetR/AcrR family transcriptional regulator [Ruegeria sp. HKCCD8929]|uniref:TetR/AcrR family transcriptional regulator n=1 Tax=Ruegeria sp. HKCCD8929 TaxID=2683006 RepID=UPI001489FCCF|nr:TetR/AcrR family transcriptional regulator [Ruegeria sp. HKCCD8929]